MLEKIVTLLMLLLAGVLLTKVNFGELLVRFLTRFLTMAIIPALLFLDCQYIVLGLRFASALAISLIHVFTVFAVSELLLRRVYMSPFRRTSALLSAVLPNVVYLPYSVYAVFGLDTAYLMPYVFAANVVLPIAVARAQIALRRGHRIMLSELTPSLVILLSIIAGLCISAISEISEFLRTGIVVREILSKLMLTSFIVLGFDIARIRRLAKDVVYPVLVRNLVSPLLMLCILLPLSKTLQMSSGYVRGLLIESLAPTAIAAVLFSRLIGADSVYAATAVSISTIISLPAMITFLCLST